MRYDHFTMLPERAFQRIGGRMTLEGSKGGSTPQAAAAQDWQNTQQGWQQQTAANRPDVNTPWGKQDWTQNGDQWTQNITLSPAEQASLNSQQAVTQGRSSAAQGLLGQATEAFDKPFDFNNAPAAGSMEGIDPAGARDRAEQALYQRQISKIEPQLTQSEDARRARMANMGFALEGGSQGFERAQAGMDQNRRAAYQDAAYQSVIGGGQEATREQAMGVQGAQEADRQRQQYIAGEAQRRGMPLNELNALLTGQQVNMPGGLQQNTNSTASQMGGSNFAGAQKQGADQEGQFWGNAASLAGTAAMFAMSDIRLKSNIKRIGTHKRGVGIYEYDIFGERTVGVMAQELMQVAPELVQTHKSGFLMVNYGGL